MRFNPITEATAHTQANAFRVWERGIYDFEVVEAHDKQSKAGNDMIELVVRVYNKEGVGRKIFDWLVDSENSAYKIRHFAQAVGQLMAYEKGELHAADLPGLTGRCELRIKKEAGYPDKNAVGDYLPPQPGETSMKRQAPASDAKAAPAFDDEIPF